MMLSIGIIVGAVFGLLVISAFFSAAETALTAASRARLHELARKGMRRAVIVQALLHGRERLIGALLLGNNVVNILASALTTALLVGLFGDAGVLYATAVMTVFVVIFCEVMPKTYAILHPERMALTVAPAVRVLVKVVGPVVLAIEMVVKGTLAVFGANVSGVQRILSAHEEIRGAIDLHHTEGAVKKRDRDMIGGILDLRELEVFDVMVHRTKMISADLERAQAAIIDDVLKSGHTRIPVWKDDPDNIVGILHAKDLLSALRENDGDAARIDVAALCAPPWFVPDTTLVSDQLAAFLRKKMHCALVVDEYGEVMGLVTLEDILEEIVGEISDEHDALAAGVRPEANGSFIVDGAVPIRDLNRAMDWQLPDAEATTLAGLVIHEAQMIPDVAQAFTFHGFRFEVLRKSRHQITSLRVTQLRRGAGQAPAPAPRRAPGTGPAAE